MVQFDEGDLFYKDYINTITDDFTPDYFTIENKNTVNIRERFEMVFFCDDYLRRYKLDKDVANFQKVEKILRARFPERPCSRKELLLYVEQNWEEFESEYIIENSNHHYKMIL